MYITESELRDQLRRPAVGSCVVIPQGARLSPAAADFVKQWGLEVQTTASGSPSSAPAQAVSSEDTSWDHASEFPVQLDGEVPLCQCCGSAVTKKPSGLTQLNAYHFAPKTHPRIRLRGRIDSLHSNVLLIQRMANQDGRTELAEHLGSVAAYCRELISAEYNERPVAPIALKEWDAEAIHRATHDPRGQLGIDHLTIDENDDEFQHRLNVVRTMSREIEITAMDAFPSPHDPSGSSICAALNRLSSAFYFLQLKLKAGERP